MSINFVPTATIDEQFANLQAVLKELKKDIDYLYENSTAGKPISLGDKITYKTDEARIYVRLQEPADYNINEVCIYVDEEDNQSSIVIEGYKDETYLNRLWEQEFIYDTEKGTYELDKFGDDCSEEDIKTIIIVPAIMIIKAIKSLREASMDRANMGPEQ